MRMQTRLLLQEHSDLALQCLLKMFLEYIQQATEADGIIVIGDFKVLHC